MNESMKILNRTILSVKDIDMPVKHVSRGVEGTKGGIELRNLIRAIARETDTLEALLEQCRGKSIAVRALTEKIIKE